MAHEFMKGQVEAIVGRGATTTLYGDIFYSDYLRLLRQVSFEPSGSNDPHFQHLSLKVTWPSGSSLVEGFINREVLDQMAGMIKRATDAQQQEHEVQRCWVLSCFHVPGGLYRMLREDTRQRGGGAVGRLGLMIDEVGEYGVRIIVGPEVFKGYFGKHPKGLPGTITVNHPALYYVMTVARDCGYDIIQLDTDGPRVAGLAWFSDSNHV